MADVPPIGPEEQDPVTSSSLSLWLMLAAVGMMLTMIWALYDEMYAMRPWKGFQKDFAGLYSEFLDKAIPAAAEKEKAIRESAEYQKLAQETETAEQAVATEVSAIDQEISQQLNPRITLMNKVFQESRGEISAMIYQLEKASESGKQSIQEDIDEVKARTLSVSFPASGDIAAEEKELLYPEFEVELNRIKTRRTDLQTKRIALNANATELRQKRDIYLKDHLGTLTEVQMRGLQNEAKSLQPGIRQIHNADIDLVDRCESCHLATRSPITITAADMGGRAEFASHPRKELLAMHDPERFGCSTCHNGNGRATTSVEKGHGRHKFWLWPMYERENVEAGCQQCHTRDMYLREATTINEGKRLFDHRGCVGCHRYEGYDSETEDIAYYAQLAEQKKAHKISNILEAERSIDQADLAESNEEARSLYDRADKLKVQSSGIDAEVTQVSLRLRDLYKERKKVGPSLKEARVKFRKDWLPVWLTNPQDYRPGTRMPRFRLDTDQVQAISAYIWQSGVEGRVQSQPAGNAASGKELFETRGCMACHSMGEGDQKQGGIFAANLSRVGEKLNYDYLVRWVHNPREKTRPYCPVEKRDLGPEDYARHGLPFVFDDDHSTCPNEGAELVISQMTVMPNLRLSFEESRDIATYLMSLKTKQPGEYAAADYLNDPAMKAKGLPLVKHFGCAGCHEIAGLEEESRIGTELSKEGSKPIERLDFALMTHPAEAEGWYNHKGFFTNKLKDPAIYDQGKVKEPLEKLRMPNFDLDEKEIVALTTFLLGSVESPFPPRYRFLPEDRRRDIQEGWKIVRKYNCMGCHSVDVGQRSSLSSVLRYTTPEWKDQLPPNLVGEGARVEPGWLAKFLENPSMSETDLSRNGVRSYLKTRMPTFFFSDGEIMKLVKFFDALSVQPQPYLAPKQVPLTEQERLLARSLFTSDAAPCLSCHATGEAVRDQRATAPSFMLVRGRLKPDWTRRWMIDPAMMSPGTAMPSGLFKQDGGRAVFSGPLPPGSAGFRGDHADLIVRYIMQFSTDELSRLPRIMPAGTGQ